MSDVIGICGSDGSVIGTIQVEETYFGAYIYVNGRCLAMVDLYYMQIKDPDRRYPQLVVYTGDDDDNPLMHIQWRHDGRVEAQVDAGWGGMKHELNREEMQHELTYPMIGG